MSGLHSPDFGSIEGAVQGHQDQAQHTQIRDNLSGPAGELDAIEVEGKNIEGVGGQVFFVRALRRFR